MIDILTRVIDIGHSVRRFFRYYPHRSDNPRYRWQRGKRGWADCDWWNMDSYLISIILPMLKEYKENKNGYPGCGEADTPEKWDEILSQMIEGFEAGKRVVDDEYHDINDSETATREEIESWYKLSLADQQKFHDGMKLFDKHFFSLWD